MANKLLAHFIWEKKRKIVFIHSFETNIHYWRQGSILPELNLVFFKILRPEIPRPPIPYQSKLKINIRYQFRTEKCSLMPLWWRLLLIFNRLLLFHWTVRRHIFQPRLIFHRFRIKRLLTNIILCLINQQFW